MGTNEERVESVESLKKMQDIGKNGMTNLLEMSLPPLVSTRQLTLIRQLGIGRSKFRTRDMKNNSILGTIERVRMYDINFPLIAFFFFSACYVSNLAYITKVHLLYFLLTTFASYFFYLICHFLLPWEILCRHGIKP